MNKTPSPRYLCQLTTRDDGAAVEVVCEATAICVARVKVQSELPHASQAAHRIAAFFELLSDNDAELNFEALFQIRRQIAVIWSIEDVQGVRPDLTDAQAWEVLKRSKQSHDASVGINWESLAAVAQASFWEATESGGDDD